MIRLSRDKNGRVGFLDCFDSVKYLGITDKEAIEKPIINKNIGTNQTPQTKIDDVINMICKV